MKTSSCKAKGRRLQQWIASKISEVTGIKSGKDCQIESREMGQQGVDIKLYGIAKEKFPFAVEAKNQETWSVPQWIKQAKENEKKTGNPWLLFCSKNREKTIVVMDADMFFDLYDRYLYLLYGKDHKENMK